MAITNSNLYLVRVFKVLRAILLAVGVLCLVPAQYVLADNGNNYTWKNNTDFPTCNVPADIDTWGYCERYCTSWVAFALNDRNGFTMPHAIGNAGSWASWVTNNTSYAVNNTAAAGAVAQWNGHSWNGGYGHVAWVSAVNGDGSVDIEEYNANNDGNYSTAKLTSGGSFPWPDNFIHFKDLSSNPTPSPSTPTAVARDSSDMDVFYSDASNNLVDRSWNSSTGWSSQQWSDTGLVYGQPAVDSRSSGSMDVFYYTSEHKLINKGWTSSGGWTGPNVLLSGGVYGDPAVVARDSSDMQVFYRTSAGEIKSISWNSSSGWNTNPQNLYSSGATTDPTAVSRGSDSMEVFFGKNNGNLVHLGWSSENGWGTQDWGAGAGVAGKPSAITRSSGAYMSAYYQESGNGKVGEEFWYWVTGWGWQDWTASLAGSPSAIPGISNVIDNFYRETGGNVVDRYFTGSAWATTNIAGSNSATGNPNAVVRGTTSIEVFFWNGNQLIDAHWDSTNGWSYAPVS